MPNEEMLPVLDARGRIIGSKPRSRLHRDDDWHMLAFVWAARKERDGRLRFLLQIRGRAGDRFAGHVDAPAGGHVLEGEDHLGSAVRECEEEVGVRVARSELAYMGRRRVESTSMDCRRTFQHHYICGRALTLDDVALNEEVEGFAEVGIDDFADLLDGRASVIPAEQVSKRHPSIHTATVGRDALSLYSEEVKETFRRAVKGARVYLATGNLGRELFQ